jgi:hypothetical protein
VEDVRAVITRDDSGEEIATVDARLTLTAGRGYRWSGSFPAPSSAVIPYVVYRLTTADGRSGLILVTAVRDCTVHFQAPSPLSRRR